MQPSASHDMFSTQWMCGLETKEGVRENESQYWSKDRSTLITQSITGTFIVGSGLDIYNSAILPAIESAQHEVILVTCFWARSPSLTNLSSALRKLSDRQIARPKGTSKLRVRLCFSSRSLFQQLFHTSSPAGYVYPPSQWVSTLGLPPPEDLQGLDLQVKSIFIRPLSVMHPKFVIIDRRLALLPSCNLSWETWLECCLPLTGPIVSSLLQFWRYIWGRNDLPILPIVEDRDSSSSLAHRSILLPSPHHRLPSFRPFLSAPSPPPTPLNTLIIHLMSTATQTLTFLTPNLTSPPVIAAILATVDRGVDCLVITNRRMMVLEQLVTAGTITELCVRRLVRDYRKLDEAAASGSQVRAEEGSGHIGRLRIGYFIGGRELKCHVKCTAVDGEVVVLGSGNMDRASWYTSQELGIALEGREIVQDVWGTLEARLDGRIEKYFGW